MTLAVHDVTIAVLKQHVDATATTKLAYARVRLEEKVTVRETTCLKKRQQRQIGLTNPVVAFHSQNQNIS